MGELVVAAAINIAIGIALSYIFPPEPIEGPRVSNLGFEASTYGRFIDISWGTDRYQGNLVDATDPVLEQRTEEDNLGGKGGGTPATTYKYFHTGRWAFGVSGATAVLKLYFNGKLIYDATGSSEEVAVEGVDFTLYPGGPDQEQDPDEVARYGVAAAQGYRHLTTIVFNRLPLATLGAGIQSCEAILAREVETSVPFEFLDLDGTGATPPADSQDFMMINPDQDQFYSLGHHQSSQTWVGNLSEFTYFGRGSGVPSAGFGEAGVDWDGYIYQPIGTNGAAPIYQYDPATGENLTIWGTGVDDTTDDSDSMSNGGGLNCLRVIFPGVGTYHLMVHTPSGVGTQFGNIWQVSRGQITYVYTVTTLDGFDRVTGTFIPDNDNNRGFYFVDNDDGDVEIWKMTVTPDPTAQDDEPDVNVFFTKLRTFSMGSAGDDFPTSDTSKAWALDRGTGNLLLSNRNNMVLYNPDSDTIVASRSDLGFYSRYNYYSGSIFGFAIDDISFGNGIYIIDTRTLETIRFTDFDDLGLTYGTNFAESSSVWDDRRQAIITGVEGGGNWVARIYVNRLSGKGINLETLMNDISSEYEGVELGGLSSSTYDYSELSPYEVPGFTINSDGELRAWVEILRQRYFFDVIEEDWLIKGRVRGGSVTETIPANRIGQRSNDRVDNPPVVRDQLREEELPMRVGIRFRNKLTDYETDYISVKRPRAPNSIVATRQEKIANLSIADEPTSIKQMAQKWLYTLWNEADTIKTRLPWEYMHLVPSDIVELTVFDEVIRTRLGNITLGAGWFLEAVGIEEDIRDYSSDVGAGNNPGHQTPSFGSLSPTDIIFLDAPLLKNADINFDTHSNAYHAVRAFSSNWPGATVFRSPDGELYGSVSGLSQEAISAKVVTPPSAWARSLDNSFRNVWQEVADGGEIVITPLRRSNLWTSASAAQVTLNGVNAAAIITEEGVEIINFQDISVDANGRITLSRLLRGRLGTEDIVDANAHASGDMIVLLDIPSIAKQALPISLINSNLLYKAVTAGTFLETTKERSFTYTGRDLRPYSVVNVEAAAGSPDGYDISWLRRSRGVNSGTLSTDPPVNETKEQYHATLRTSTGILVLQKTIDDATSVHFSQDEVDPAGEDAYIEISQVSGTGLLSPITIASKVTVQGSDVYVPPPVIDPGGDGAGLQASPTALSTVTGTTYNVSTKSGFVSAMNSAVGGDEIVIADGTYNNWGDVEINSSGASTSSPIIVRAATKHGATFSGNVTFHIRNRFIELFGIEMLDTTGYGIVGYASSQHVRITQCRFENVGIGGGDEMFRIYADSKYYTIDNCELTDCVQFGMILYGNVSDPNHVQGHWVHHNWFHDTPKRSGNGHEAFTCIGGQSYASEANVSNVLEYNLFDSWSGESELMSIKTSGYTVRKNYIVDCDATFNIRDAQQTVLDGNVVVNSRGIGVNNKNNIIINNLVFNSGEPCLILFGESQIDVAGSGRIPATDNWIADNVFQTNEEPIFVNYRDGTIVRRVRDNTLKDNIIYNSSGGDWLKVAGNPDSAFTNYNTITGNDYTGTGVPAIPDPEDL